MPITPNNISRSRSAQSLLTAATATLGLASVGLSGCSKDAGDVGDKNAIKVECKEDGKSVDMSLKPSDKKGEK